MAFLNTLNIIGSGLTAQQLRLDIVSENVTNSSTTRTENGDEAYRRKVVRFQSVTGAETFEEAMARVARGGPVARNGEQVGGVRVTDIIEEQTDFKLVYDPTHPDADDEGYVSYPNVDMVKEVTDAMAATQAYSANITVMNAVKDIMTKGLEIGR